MNNNFDTTPFGEEKPRSPLIGLAILGLAIAGCCVIFIAAFFLFQPDQLSLVNKYFPSPTATLTPTATLPPTATPTRTPNTTATARILNITATAQAFENTSTNTSNQWPEILSDEFIDNQNNWSVGKDNDAHANILRSIKDGKYLWDATAHKGFISWVTADTKSVSDFYLSADARQIDGTNHTDFGLMFRVDPDFNFYYFGVKNNQQYSLSVFNNNDWNYLIDWTYSNALTASQPNQMSVFAEEDHIVLFINGHYVADIYDDSIQKGKTAFMINMDKADDQASFEFDNFELRAP